MAELRLQPETRRLAPRSLAATILGVLEGAPDEWERALELRRIPEVDDALSLTLVDTRPPGRDYPASRLSNKQFLTRPELERSYVPDDLVAFMLRMMDEAMRRKHT